MERCLKRFGKKCSLQPFKNQPPINDYASACVPGLRGECSKKARWTLELGWASRALRSCLQLFPRSLPWARRTLGTASFPGAPRTWFRKGCPGTRCLGSRGKRSRTRGTGRQQQKTHYRLLAPYTDKKGRLSVLTKLVMTAGTALTNNQTSGNDGGHGADEQANVPPEGQQYGLPALPPEPHWLPHAPQFKTDAEELTLVQAKTVAFSFPQHL